MATTPILALPYPTLSDTADVPRDIQALATKLDGYSSVSPPLRTTLPGSPVDGQEIYYQADVTNGVVWHLRYRAGASTYKWECLGGARLRAGVTASNAWTSPAAFAWQNAPGGPAVTLPLAGEYELDWNGAAVVTSPTAVTDFRMSITGHPTGNVPSGGGAHAQNVVINAKGSALITATAGQVVTLQVATVIATCAFALYDRIIWARPIRVA